MSRSTTIILITILLLVCCCLEICLGIAGGLYYLGRQTVITPVVISTPVPIEIPTPTPGATVAPVPTTASMTLALETLARIQATTPPTRDLISVTQRVKLKSEQPIPTVVNPMPPSYSVGQRQTFFVADITGKKYYTITATLRVITPHLYMYVKDGERVKDSDLQASANVFENQIYPTNRRWFGPEAAVSIDNDSRITILNTPIAGAGGYFSSADAYPRLINPYSNERRMIYADLISLCWPGSSCYNSTLAHEFQHMIHWAQDRDEEGWVNEGLSVFAQKINGFSDGGVVSSFLNQPNTQLNTWKDEPAKSVPHYGASFLFTTYLADHYGGEETIRQLTSEPENEMKGIEATLVKRGYSQRFNDVFKDWVIANYLNTTTVDGGRYAYKDLKLQTPATERITTFPASRKTTVSQFATRYYELRPGSSVQAQLMFTGTETVRLVNAAPKSGNHLWWSNRGDDKNSRLTRSLDLRSVQKATLTFAAWYDIEKDFDYAYVEVSTDNGKTWTTLPTRYTTTTDPNGANLGHGLTGKSGGGTEPVWVTDQADLTPYAGKTILLRFEYVTDDAYNAPGLVLDDIAVPEIHYSDDAESDSQWQAEGFVRSAGILPQTYAVQLILFGDTTSVTQVTLNVAQQGQVMIPNLGGKVRRAVLAVSGLTPYTTEPASFSFSVRAVNIGD